MGEEENKLISVYLIYLGGIYQTPFDTPLIDD